MRQAPYILNPTNDGNLQVKDMSMTGLCPNCGFAGAFHTLNNHWRASTREATLLMVCLHCKRFVMVEARPYELREERVVAVFPSSARVFPYEGFEFVPPEIREALAETYSALEKRAYTLTGLGCRVVLERLVQGKGYRDGRGLEVRLEELRAGYPDLVGPLSSADVIRLVGNTAAHDAYRKITRDEAESTLEFTEEVLRAVFIAPQKLKRIAAAFPP